MKTIISLFIFIILLTNIGILKAVTCTAITDGNWDHSDTWSCGRAPENNDDLVIPSGKKVTVNIVTPVYSGMTILVNGELEFLGGKKINMEGDGVITVSATGSLTGGNGGSKIVIGGTTVWNGPGPDQGPFTLGGSPLPIELKSFTAKTIEGDLIIEWITSMEKNNNYFNIERSKNGLDFREYAKIPGIGNSIEEKKYNYKDPSPIEGTSYYRLKQVDFDGKSKTYGMISIYFEKKPGNGCVLKVYPNPCPGNCIVDLSGCDQKDNPEIRIDILDAMGNSVMTKIPERDSRGSFSFSMDTRNNLSPGVYVIRGISNKEKYAQKVIIK